MPLPSLRDHFAGRVEDLWAIYDGLGSFGTAVVQSVGVVMGLGDMGETPFKINPLS